MKNLLLEIAFSNLTFSPRYENTKIKHWKQFFSWTTKVSFIQSYFLVLTRILSWQYKKSCIILLTLQKELMFRVLLILYTKIITNIPYLVCTEFNFNQVMSSLGITWYLGFWFQTWFFPEIRAQYKNFVISRNSPEVGVILLFVFYFIIYRSWYCCFIFCLDFYFYLGE